MSSILSLPQDCYCLLDKLEPDNSKRRPGRQNTIKLQLSIASENLMHFVYCPCCPVIMKHISSRSQVRSTIFWICHLYLTTQSNFNTINNNNSNNNKNYNNIFLHKLLTLWTSYFLSVREDFEFQSILFPLLIVFHVACLNNNSINHTNLVLFTWTILTFVFMFWLIYD